MTAEEPRKHEASGGTDTFVPRFKLNGECTLRPMRGIYDALGVSPPKKRTQTQLLQERKAAMIPDKSYDLDGDGAVGQKDYFLARQFDTEKKGFLTSPERKKCQEALAQGFEERFLIGDCTRETRQKSGVIYRPCDMTNLNDVYDHPKRAVPAHWTKTDLRQDRLAELRAAGSEKFERWLQENPRRSDQPLVSSRSGHLSTQGSPVSNARRTQQEMALFRSKSGMLPSPTLLNPDRETLHLGLDFVESPTIGTRNELLRARRENEIQDMENKRQMQEESFIPHSARKSRRLEEEYRAAIPKKPRQTLTKLKLDRKRECIEFEHTHSAHYQHQLPRFSDQATPWWMTTSPTSPSPPRLRQVQSECMLPVMASPSPSRSPLSPAHTVSPKKLCSAADSPVKASPSKSRPDDGIHKAPFKRWTSQILEEKYSLFSTLPAGPEHASDMPLQFEQYTTDEGALGYTDESKLRTDSESHTLSTSLLTRSLECASVASGVSAARKLQCRPGDASLSTASVRSVKGRDSGSVSIPVMRMKGRSPNRRCGGYNSARGSMELPHDGSSHYTCEASISSIPVHVSAAHPQIPSTFRDIKTPEALAFASSECKEKVGSIRSGGFVESRSENKEKTGRRRQRSRPSSGRSRCNSRRPSASRTALNSKMVMEP